MKVLFDFLHPVDINFFRQTIKVLEYQGHDIFLVYRERGPISKILRFEFPNNKPVKIGNHVKGITKKIIAQLFRDFLLFKYLRKNKIDITLSFGPSVGFSSWICRIPFVSFADDPEYKLTLYHALLFANKLIMPNFNGLPKSVIKYRGYKELAYLHPRVFKNDMLAVEKYEVKQNEFVFIREIANTSLNYKVNNNRINEIVKYLSAKNIKVLLSIEDKSKIKEFDKYCIILEEPVENIHSLIKNALLTITSGDTVARESAILGTPVIYTGGRDMRANNEFIDIGVMYKEETFSRIIELIDTFLNKKSKKFFSDKILEKALNEWDNVTSVIVESINDFMYDNKSQI